MVAERGQAVSRLDLDTQASVLEIMTGESDMIHSFVKGVRQVETIEADPASAYLASWKSVQAREQKHLVFCGQPHTFLRQKIDNYAKIDIVMIHADRLEHSRKVWSLIAILKPRWVILAYSNSRKGKYNKKLMEINGFKIIKQEGDITNGISERFCVGCCNERYSG